MKIIMEIKHYENGDSEYKFPITIRVGASMTGSSSVQQGRGELYRPLTIYQQDMHKFRVYYKDDYLSPIMKSKEECIEWIIDNLKGT